MSCSYCGGTGWVGDGTAYMPRERCHLWPKCKEAVALDGRIFCKIHRVPWDELQSEPSDKCMDCGRTRAEHKEHEIERLAIDAYNQWVNDCGYRYSEQKKWALLATMERQAWVNVVKLVKKKR